MKIRRGFVSNSSSSSFLIAGVKVPLEEFRELRKKLQDKPGYIDTDGYPWSEDVASYDEDYRKELEEYGEFYVGFGFSYEGFGSFKPSEVTEAMERAEKHFGKRGFSVYFGELSSEA